MLLLFLGLMIFFDFWFWGWIFGLVSGFVCLFGWFGGVFFKKFGCWLDLGFVIFFKLGALIKSNGDGSLEIVSRRTSGSLCVQLLAPKNHQATPK